MLLLPRHFRPQAKWKQQLEAKKEEERAAGALASDADKFRIGNDMTAGGSREEEWGRSGRKGREEGKGGSVRDKEKQREVGEDGRR